jgi:hypothetical protein
VFDVIEAEPGRLRQVDGIGPARANHIVVGWAEQRVVREHRNSPSEASAMQRGAPGSETKARSPPAEPASRPGGSVNFPHFGGFAL